MYLFIYLYNHQRAANPLTGEVLIKQRHECGTAAETVKKQGCTDSETNKQMQNQNY